MCVIDLVGLRIHNTKCPEKAVGINFRRRDQRKPDVVRGVLGTVGQSNAHAWK